MQTGLLRFRTDLQTSVYFSVKTVYLSPRAGLHVPLHAHRQSSSDVLAYHS